MWVDMGKLIGKMILGFKARWRRICMYDGKMGYRLFVWKDAKLYILEEILSSVTSMKMILSDQLWFMRKRRLWNQYIVEHHDQTKKIIIHLTDRSKRTDKYHFLNHFSIFSDDFLSLKAKLFYMIIIIMKQFNKIVIDPFCHRQFLKGAAGHIDYDIQQFQARANQYYQKADLLDGYASFCKHIFIENFANVMVSVAEITPNNEHLLRTAYEARTEKELPVLKRFFPKEKMELKPAKYLDLILYSKAQVQKENESMGNKDPNADVDYDFGIVSIKPSDVPYETPMDPITMMRNALGKEHGGSGVALDRQKYEESVKYWSSHALIK